MENKESPDVLCVLDYNLILQGIVLSERWHFAGIFELKNEG